MLSYGKGTGQDWVEAGRSVLLGVVGEVSEAQASLSVSPTDPDEELSAPSRHHTLPTMKTMD